MGLSSVKLFCELLKEALEKKSDLTLLSLIPPSESEQTPRMKILNWTIVMMNLHTELHTVCFHPLSLAVNGGVDG